MSNSLSMDVMQQQNTTPASNFQEESSLNIPCTDKGSGSRPEDSSSSTISNVASKSQKSDGSNGISGNTKAESHHKGERITIRLATVKTLKNNTSSKNFNGLSDKTADLNSDSEGSSNPDAMKNMEYKILDRQQKLGSDESGSQTPTSDSENSENDSLYEVDNETESAEDSTGSTTSIKPKIRDEKVEKRANRPPLQILSPSQINDSNSPISEPSENVSLIVNSRTVNEKTSNDFEGFSPVDTNRNSSKLRIGTPSKKPIEHSEEMDEILPSSFLQCNVDSATNEQEDFVKSQHFQLNCDVKILLSRLKWNDISARFCFLNKISIICGNRIRKVLRGIDNKNNPKAVVRVKRKHVPAAVEPEPESFENPDVFTHSIFGSIMEPTPKKAKKNHSSKPPGRISSKQYMPRFTTSVPQNFNPTSYGQNRFMVAFPPISPPVSSDMLVLAPSVHINQPLGRQMTMPMLHPVPPRFIQRPGQLEAGYRPYLPPPPMRHVPPLPPADIRQATPTPTPSRQKPEDPPPVITLDDKSEPVSDSKSNSGRMSMENFSCNGPTPSRGEIVQQLEKIYSTVLVLMKIGYPTEQKSIMNLVYQLLVAGPCCCMMHAVISINYIDLMKHLNLPHTEPNYTFTRPVVPCIMKGTYTMPKEDTFIIKRFVFAVAKETRTVMFPLPPFCVPKENSLVDKITILMVISARNGFGPGLVVYPHALLTPKLRDSFFFYPHLQNWSVSGHQSGGLTQSMLKEFLADVAVPWMRSLDTFSSASTMLVDWWWSTRPDDLPSCFNSFQIINLQEMYSLYFDPLDIHLGINMQRLWGLLNKKWSRINSELKEHDFPRFFLQAAQKLLGSGKITDLAYHSGMLPLDYVKAANYDAKQTNY